MWNIKGLACCILLLQFSQAYRLKDAAADGVPNFLDDDGGDGVETRDMDRIRDAGNLDDIGDGDDDVDVDREEEEEEEEDDGYGGRHRQKPERTPDFVTLGQKYSVAIGSTIVLPCKINDSALFDHYVLAWKRDIAVLTAANVKVTMNPRIRLMPHQSPTGHKGSSYNLEIQNVRNSDAGDYACQVGTIVPKEIVHRLEVLVPPKINFLAPTNKLEVSKGTSIRLECRASGIPQPLITWTRKNNVMPNGEANVTNNVLEMMHADRHTVGHYKCTADNHVGQPDERDVTVNVLYAPDIEVERPFVHTGVGHETQLVCIVHAEPPPQVIWYKGSTQLGVTEQHSQQSRGNRYALNIRNVTVADLGNYTCQASNQLGKDRKALTVSGIPSICEIVESPRVSNYHDQYNISWSVESYETIFEYRLFYRLQTNGSNRLPYAKLIRDKSPGGTVAEGTHHFVHPEYQADWRDIIIVPQPAASSSASASMYASNDGYPHYHSSSGRAISASSSSLSSSSSAASSGSQSAVRSYGSSRQLVVNNNAWNPNGRQKMSYMMTNLRPAANYEVRVQARNVHGWNRLSTTFHFTTADYVVDDNTISGAADFRPLTLQSSSTSSAAPGVHGAAATTSAIAAVAYVVTSLAFFRAFCMQSGGGAATVVAELR